MIDLRCDICGERIHGDYKKVMNESTNAMILDGFRMDICKECWGFLMGCKNQRRSQMIDFPNSKEE